jgi:hypothetical protein
MENKSITNCDRRGLQITEHLPNSKSDTSSKAESPILSLAEHYVLNRAINQWDGPNYVTYCTKGTRLRSSNIHEWSHVLEPATIRFERSLFSFTGKIRRIF